MPHTVDAEKLKQFVPFDGLSLNHVRCVASSMESLELAPNRVLFKRDQTAEDAFFLIDGAVDLADASFQIQHFPAADDLNFLALDNFGKHRVSAITTEKSVVYRIPRRLLSLLDEWVALGNVVDDDNETDADAETSWMDSLLESGLFSQIPPTNIQSLFTRFTPLEVEMGEAVIQEGDAGETFFVIKRGYALVRKQLKGKVEAIAELHPGQFFGEDALIANNPRGASIVMASDGEMMCLGKDDFRALLQDSVIKHLTPEELDQLQSEDDRSAVLVDIRPEMDARHDRVPGAKNIPLKQLRQSFSQLEKDFIYAICDKGGDDAGIGAYLLSDAGFDAYVLDQEKPAAPNGDDDTESSDTSAAQPTEDNPTETAENPSKG